MGQLRREPNAGGRERMPARDRAAVRIQPGILRVDAHSVAPGEHLHGERLIELEEPHVVERQTRLSENMLRRRDGPDSHQLRLDAGERIGDEPHLRRQPELARGLLRGQQAGRRAVGEPGAVAGRDPPAGAERRPQLGQSFE